MTLFVFFLIYIFYRFLNPSIIESYTSVTDIAQKLSSDINVFLHH